MTADGSAFRGRGAGGHADRPPAADAAMRNPNGRDARRRIGGSPSGAAVGERGGSGPVGPGLVAGRSNPRRSSAAGAGTGRRDPGPSHLDGIGRLRRPEPSARRHERTSSRLVRPISALPTRKSTPANGSSAITTHRESRMRLPRAGRTSGAVRKLLIWKGVERGRDIFYPHADGVLPWFGVGSRGISAGFTPRSYLRGNGVLGTAHLEDAPFPGAFARGVPGKTPPRTCLETRFVRLSGASGASSWVRRRA